MTTAFWGGLMEQALGVLKDEKSAAMLLAGVLFLAYHAYTWASDQHEGLVKQTEFSALKTTVEEGFEDSEINDASQTLRLLKIDLRIAKATGATETELTGILEEISSAKAYKLCLVERRPNCEHLKEPE